MSKQRNKKKSLEISSELYFWAQALVFALVILVSINVFFFRISGVDGSSMNPTLSTKDQVIMQVIGYNRPAHGDIIVVKAEAFKEEPLVKRVIGVAGDVLDIDESGTVYRNGEALYEPYIKEIIREQGGQSYPYTVPQGYVFVMGDNRNASTDSRDLRVGALPCDNIIGRVILRVWPITSFGGVK